MMDRQFASAFAGRSSSLGGDRGGRGVGVSSRGGRGDRGNGTSYRSARPDFERSDFARGESIHRRQLTGPHPSRPLLEDQHRPRRRFSDSFAPYTKKGGGTGERGDGRSTRSWKRVNRAGEIRELAASTVFENRLDSVQVVVYAPNGRARDARTNKDYTFELTAKCMATKLIHKCRSTLSIVFAVKSPFNFYALVCDADKMEFRVVKYSKGTKQELQERIELLRSVDGEEEGGILRANRFHRITLRVEDGHRLAEVQINGTDVFKSEGDVFVTDEDNGLCGGVGVMCERSKMVVKDVSFIGEQAEREDESKRSDHCISPFNVGGDRAGRNASATARSRPRPHPAPSSASSHSSASAESRRVAILDGLLEVSHSSDSDWDAIVGL